MDSLPPFGGLHHPALVSPAPAAKLRGGDACQKGLSSPPLSKQETHVQESKQLAKLVERSCLLAPSCTGLSLAPAKRAERKRLIQVSKHVAKEERKGEGRAACFHHPPLVLLLSKLASKGSGRQEELPPGDSNKRARGGRSKDALIKDDPHTEQGASSLQAGRE